MFSLLIGFGLFYFLCYRGVFSPTYLALIVLSDIFFLMCFVRLLVFECYLRPVVSSIFVLFRLINQSRCLLLLLAILSGLYVCNVNCILDIYVYVVIQVRRV